ncbi:MAG: VOC family protein [Candidatus Promineifilaceae bacterium]|nr:VOC family protein [Candidatus Promineifilaceae bacterium]
MTIQGLHHITLVSSNAQRTVDFYTGVLGLRLVKKTVNFDDPGAYHLYFGDVVGTPGSAVTFFEWPHAQPGRPGIGGTHHFALGVADYDGLLKWKRRLTDLGITVSGPYERHYFTSIYFRDPDGVIVEIATLGPGMTVDEESQRLGQAQRHPPDAFTRGRRDETQIAAIIWDEPVTTVESGMALRHGIHHISAIGADIQRTDAFLSGVLGLRRIKMTSNFDDPGMAHWYWGNESGEPGTLVTYFEYDLNRKNYHRVRMGVGQTHHYALTVPDEETQLAFRQRLLDAGYRVSAVMDRIYFKSIYTSDPDGHIVELATYGPGFTIDEEEASLGRALMLPPWLERHRPEIERSLTPIHIPNSDPIEAIHE